MLLQCSRLQFLSQLRHGLPSSFPPWPGCALPQLFSEHEREVMSQGLFPCHTHTAATPPHAVGTNHAGVRS
eukprot:1830911-Prymnesium_polylepis.1